MTDQQNEPERTQPVHGQHFLGSFLLFLGAGLLLVSLIDSSTGLPFNMPRFWYINRSLWYFMAFASLLCGTVLLRQRTQRSSKWKPSQLGIRFKKAVLYTRNGCHLCDQARDLLVKYRNYFPEIEEIDIDANSEFREKFDTCVPVVEFDGKVRFRGHVDELLLRRLIEGTAPL